jgi:hypothetical protein
VFAIVCLATFTRLLLDGRGVLIGLMVFVGSTSFILYVLTVRQFVTTYASPLFASAAAMVAWGAWAPRSSDDTLVEPDCRPRSNTERWSSSAVYASAFLVVLLMVTTFRGVTSMHDRLDGWDRVVDLARAANDAVGPDCRLVTARVPQVAWYSECVVVGLGAPAPAGPEEVGGYLTMQYERNGIAGTEDRLGFVLLDGLAGQPAIDDLWPESDPQRSIILEASDGRRAALVVVP